jgi:hypothetical protein
MVSIICQKISQNGRAVLDISRTQIFADISKKYPKKVWKIDFHEKWKKFHYSYLICRIQCKTPQVHTLLSSKVSFKWYTTPLTHFQGTGNYIYVGNTQYIHFIHILAYQIWFRRLKRENLPYKRQQIWRLFI